MLGAILVAGVASPLSAQTREELQAAIRRLRQVEASLDPLPYSGITRDVGQIAIVEHDGSAYDDRLPDGTLNYEARTRVGLRFYENHADQYDFLVVFTNFAFKTSDATAFHLYGRNDVEGIGKPVGGTGTAVFGSPARLKGWVDMADVSQYRERPFAVSPGDPGFQETLNVLAHELGHQWLAEARYKAGDVIYDDLLGQDGNHWSYLLDSDASLFYGADWRASGDGTFTAAHVKERYSSVDLYLMGLLPKEKVPPLLLLQNPAIDRQRINREGEVVATTGTTEIPVDQLIDAMGPRRPDSVHSQKEFRLGFVFLTKPGTEPSPEDLQAVEQVRRAFGAHFFAFTRGVAWADTTLVETPSGPRAAAPDLQRALAWLAAQQGLDGSWSDAAETRSRDTAAAVWALATAGASGPTWQRGIAWLQQAQPESLDFRARLASALAPRSLTASNRATRTADILSSQNADGGFGAGVDFSSDALDTALALRALRALEYPEDARVRLALTALSGLANADGGWPAVAGGETSTVTTAEVLLALLDWSDVPGSAALRAAGLAALLARQNPDKGFGSSPSAPHASALVLDVLLRSGAPADVIDPLTAWLQQSQLADGSWAGSPYQTALVLAALRQSLGANLVVPADTLVVAPNPAREGEGVRVAARIRNAGREAASATLARLYDGDPASSPAGAEASVPPLAPGEEVEIAFDYPTQDRPGLRTLYVVADAADQVRESREDDNTASRALTVVGKLPDLVVGPESIAVSPASPEVGEPTAITVAVRNVGERSSGASAVLVSITDPTGASTHLPLAVLPAVAPGGLASVSVPWSPGRVGAHLIHATADARYDVPESDEANNIAERPASVVDGVPNGPELAMVSPVLAPTTLTELPQEIGVRAIVENRGRSAATSTVTVFDGSWGGPILGTLPIQIEPRAAAPIELRVTVATPGLRPLVLVADPDDQIGEVDEADNVASVPLGDARTLDLALDAGSVALSSPEVVSGETVTVTLGVRNRGTVDVPLVPVQLADAANGRELARVDVEVPAGQTRTATLTWRTETPGEVPLLVRVDPFDLLRETREDNNAVTLGLAVRPSGLPNLAVSGADVAFTPDPPLEGDTATVSALVCNLGVVPAGAFGVRFFVGDPDQQGVPIGEAAVSGLGPQSATTASITWSPVNARGSLGLFVVADPSGQVEESDESDNRAFRPFQATGLPDLVLTAADVVLEPGYPRAGEAVTIHATVRNLGGRSSETPTTLTVAEGEADARIGVGNVPVPPLEPGAFVTLSLPWTPVAPPGARPLSLFLDPEGLVVEQDEGNNEVRNTVVVQDADLFLTEPYFSPDGDGIKDQTTLAWRATGRVRVVVSNARGEGVRTLVEDGPESGSVTWDGRNARGVVAWDGSYTMSVTSEAGQRLGSATVVLDTNRSPIHDATPGRTTIRNLSCALPEYLRGPAWTAGEDEVLFIVPDARQGFPVGLLRVGLNGGYSYVAQDEWYRHADFASEAPVSPDGRDVLLRESGVFLVDLLTGERRSLGSWGSNLRWSPDGRFILAGDTVLARDGSPVADIGWAEWVWSPASDRLARLADTYETSGDEVGRILLVSRDGSMLDSIPLPWGETRGANWVSPQSLVWRGDGRIVAVLESCVGVQDSWAECQEHTFLVDPDALAATRLSFSARNGVWSPDGGRVLLPDGGLYLAGGASLGPLLPSGVTVSPRATAATFWKSSGDTSQPGSVCGGKPYDMFVVSSAANLAAQLEVARLPGNNGLVIRGTAADRNLERFQLDYASQADPTNWHPIGAALGVPVLDDVFTVWVPPGPGTYVLRLSAGDLAGHSSVRTQLVSWDRVPLLANFTQSDYYLSPDGNEIKDAVLFRYTVLSPTRVDVRVVGPEPGNSGDPAAREVWRTAFEHTTWGPQSFSWDGRDASGQVVPDGRYTVSINDLPFRVEVDNTPPEIGLRFENLHPASALVSTPEPRCQPGGLWKGGLESVMRLSSVAADRAWHVFDERLKSWLFRQGTSVLERDSDPVFVPDIDAYGGPVLEGGRPRARREAGRLVDRREAEYVLGYAHWNGLELEAWDVAGNHSRVTVDRPEEAVFPLGAVWADGCEAAVPVLAVEATPGEPVNPLKPAGVVLQAGTTLRLAPEEQDLRLVFRPIEGGAERELPLEATDFEGHRNLDIQSFDSLGIDPTRTYTGHFTGRGESGDFSSPSFAFCPCSQWLRAGWAVPAEPDPKTFVIVQVHLGAAVLKAQADLEIERILGGSKVPWGTLDLLPLDERTASVRFGIKLDGVQGETFFAQLPDLPIDCANRLHVSARVRDVEGRAYPSAAVESACQRPSFVMPDSCHFAVGLSQTFPGCSGSPEIIHVGAVGTADRPAHVTIERGPLADATIVDSFDFVPTPRENGFGRRYEVPVEGYSGETYPLRARVVPLDPVFGEGASASLFAFVDRTAPTGEILLPPEGGSVCLARDNPAPPLNALARIDDASPRVDVRASWRKDGGAWNTLTRLCDAACQRDPTVPAGRPFALAWDAGQADSGWYDLQMRFCDPSGNQGSTTRRVLVTRDPPTSQIGTLVRPIFSPNGDGRAEDTQVILRMAQAGSLSVRVRAGSSEGTLARTLWTDVPQPATDVLVSWDGRGDDGKTVPDGVYAIVFSVADACGGAREVSTQVEVDTVPPEVEITEPEGGQRVSASVDVLGRATDSHLATWALDLNCGGSPDWTRLAAQTYPVAPGEFLARWDTSRAPPGECRLRLVAEDRAQNRSPEALAMATVERGELLQELSATPDVFSPNGDGRRETATLGYGLLRAARVRLEVRDSGGRVLRAFETGAEREAGAWSHVWDGLDASGRPAAEGVHVVWVRAEDPAVSTVYEEKTIRLDLDRTPPEVGISRPASDGFASPAGTVRGSVTDRNLALFTVSVAPAGSPAAELYRGSQGSSTERDLAPLSSLAEGPHVLRVVASDKAENETRLDRAFTVDATPPRAAIHAPANGAFLRRGEAPIPVTGLVGDDHLESWTLRFGAGATPASFVTIGQGDIGGNGIPLGSWDVRFLPDGLYTLSLVATDRAGLSAESRATVTLDGSPPTVALSSPIDGGYVKAPGPIVGTATDASFSSWELESAPGGATTAYQWSPLGSGTKPVADGTLSDWSPLPPDGVYTLRLTARDKVDLSASTRATVTVDTTPPAMPTGLRAKVTKAREGYGNVVLTWDANTEPDLAGYRVERPKEEWSTQLLGSPAWDDGERVEGRYTYRVLAEDKAGNQSPAATLVVLVDLTPPLVSFSTPAADAFVAGAIDVRGTAWSADDFAEYRLSVGAGDAPTSWTLLRRSSVPVAAGTLGEWLALVDGPHVLALEAEDTNGNETRVTRRVVVDTLPPEPPVLTAVAKQPAPADWLVPSWQPSPSSDVIGTLVYRNGRLANSTSVVLGDRKGFLVPGTSYEDRGLPDGEHCYRVVAMDGAGNESAPSNEMCQSLDNRAPRALIVNPTDGTRFGYPVRVVAETPDLDVASVRFERRAPGAADWIGFGDIRSAPPWETTLDPKPPGGEELPAGAHELRGVATDRTGNTDPDPARITVVYGDTSPPPAPTNLVGRVDGASVSLTWTPVDAPDLASYRLYRDGGRIAEGLTEPSYVDVGLVPGTYEYVVTAVDADTNESAASAPAEAVVYAVRLLEPAWPVVSTPFASVNGEGARPETTVKILRDGAAIAEGAAAGGAFRIEGVPLVSDGNVFQARGEDAAGNRSIPSNEIVLISNSPPAAVTGLEAGVDGAAVSLRWAPVAESDLVGYVVRRDGQRLTGTVPQSEAAAFEATPWWEVGWAFDGNPATAWTPDGSGTGTWTVIFPAPILVEQIRLRFAQPGESNPGIPASYTLLARWQGRDLPVARVRGNAKLTADHRLPTPFLTTALSVVLESPGGLAEVAVERLDVVPVGTESFQDEGVPDDLHTYEIAAIDRYGAEGPAGSVEAAVGDVDPPGPPTGLVATPIARDVQLAWDPNPEPDVTHYVVLRDASRIGASPLPSYLDPGRPNGTYRYTVIAVDAAGHESGESDPAEATIDLQPVPPPAPVILEPTDAAHPISLAVSCTDVAGRADPGSSVALVVDGQLRGTAPAAPGFRAVTHVALGTGYEIALSPDGRWAAWGASPGTIAVQDLDSGEVRALSHGGSGGVQRLVFSPDSSALALSRRQAAPPYLQDVAVLRLADGSARVLISGFPTEYAWSPDGTKLALSRDENGEGVLRVIDVATGESLERGRSSGIDTHLRWSPDERRLAYIRSWWSEAAAELQVLDLGSSRARVLDPQPWLSAPPSWSPDGRRLAWTTAGTQPLHVVVQDVEQDEPSAEVIEPGSDAVDARFSPDGNWLSYVRLTPLPEGVMLRSVHAVHQGQGLRVTVSEPQEAYGLPDSHEWLGGRLAIRVSDQLALYAPDAGRFVIRDVPLVPGENRLVARATDPATGLTSADSETVLVTVPTEAFPDLAVVPEGILSMPPVPLAGLSAQLRVRVENRGTTDAGETDVVVRVVEPGGAVVLDTRATLSAVVSGGESSILLSWTPAAPGTYTVRVEVDPDGRVPEASEANNTAERAVIAVAGEGLTAEVTSDRSSYPSLDTAHVTLQVVNTGTPFTGMARTTVEDEAGSEVALLDERAVSLEWGKSMSFALDWSTGTTPAGRYAFRVRVRANGETAPAAAAERPFAIEPGLTVLTRVRPQPLAVVEGTPAGFVLSVKNQSTNVLLDGATARLSVQPEGTSGPATFETVRALPSLPTGATWGATDVWPAAQPAGRYAIRFEVTKGDVVLGTATAILTVEPAAAMIRGMLTVEPGQVLSGETAEARLLLANQGTAPVSGYPLAVEVVSGPEATVQISVPGTVDLAVGESRSLAMAIPSAGIAPGPYVVRLRGGASPITLDRSRLVIHGLIAPPSPHAPADGARVDTAHPPLVVNDASSPEGAALTYEFQIFGDEGLTQELPGAKGVPETASRTSWTVAAGLAEDATYWWRARATDGFSTSPWSVVTSFTVDAVNRPPTAPVPDTPVPGARIASRQPALVVRNAADPERQPLTYEFRLALDESMSLIVAAEAGVAEGPGFTSWTVTTILDEDATCYWSARARTAGDAPEDFSPWSAPVAFVVDTVNGSPTVPRPLRPIGGEVVATQMPALVVENSTDPENDPLTYRFEIDAQPDLGSPDRQVSAELPAGLGETTWTPPLELRENTLYYWRARASDGRTETTSALASFFVNVANEAPSAPVPLDPVDGRTVGTATPALRLRNASDPEGDRLTYEIEVRDVDDAVVASGAEVPSGPDETTWSVTSPLAEDQAFTWSARAGDGELLGPWSARAAFRVDAVAEPPTAPVPLQPPDGTVVEERRPTLVVGNAASQDGLALTYAFELEAVAADGSATLVERAEGIAEAPETTAWTPSIDLADGGYQWRARASDPRQDGPWSATWRFGVLVDPPPAPPLGLHAVAGDARVRLDWDASPEPDVTGYRVYRSTIAGGPYAFVVSVAVPGYDDLGVTNDVTYYYVVTASDARAESGYSNEGAARPEVPQSLVAEVRYDPAVVRAECLLPDHREGALLAAGVGTSCRPRDCPDWLLATLELPAGHDPAAIAVASLRLFGSVAADSGYGVIVDVDRDGLPELQARFPFEAVAPHLSVGVNSASIVARAGTSEVRGAGTIEVLALSTDLRVTPRTLQQRSRGQDVLARVTFAEGVAGADVLIASVRLNGAVPADRLVHSMGRELLLKFDRAAVIRVLPPGDHIEVRVTGTLQALPFTTVDYIRVIE